MKIWSEEACDTIIRQNKDDTAWFDESVTFDSMVDMLRNRMKFGEAETAILMAALIKAGARFLKN